MAVDKLAVQRFSLQEMGPEHISQVAEIEKDSFSPPWPAHAFEFEVFHNKLAKYFVAVSPTGLVLGYGGMWIILDEAHITNLAVLKAFRGQGIGKKLMLALMHQALSDGASRMTLEVRPSNSIARHIYKRLGFEERGVRSKYYQDNQEDAIIMWKGCLND